eukprot:6829453-Prymnesium_polylepis.1
MKVHVPSLRLALGLLALRRWVRLSRVRLYFSCTWRCRSHGVDSRSLRGGSLSQFKGRLGGWGHFRSFRHPQRRPLSQLSQL